MTLSSAIFDIISSIATYSCLCDFALGRIIIASCSCLSDVCSWAHAVLAQACRGYGDVVHVKCCYSIVGGIIFKWQLNTKLLDFNLTPGTLNLL